MGNMPFQKCRKKHVIEQFNENNTKYDDRCLNDLNFPIPQGMNPTFEPALDPLPCNPNLISMSKPLERTISHLVLRAN